VKGICDTGFIVAFLNRDDRYHAWAVALASQLTEPLLTCEAVLAESAFKVLSVAAVMKLVRDGMLTLSFSLNDNLAQIQELALRYEDRHPDLADLCVVRMSELHPRHSVVTVDTDFRIYRRNKREAIPLIFPRDNT
jgi:predicted nucleic acid-binding protein